MCSSHEWSRAGSMLSSRLLVRAAELEQLLSGLLLLLVSAKRICWMLPNNLLKLSTKIIAIYFINLSCFGQDIFLR